ncbi:hypothetical protein IQ241_20005 [Romeria aff. gracilis LEGE 07310]|uniref:Uncharacterized protein n=1 Tax=Vasconcelosia minhoensis LEGE 07310 TaxID=915328 RepID=A0A8J7DD53_9CYAN|nr:hypothetical protein [Romeria gracilis]MBE9079552.1 hypothetical protein [Romeria aff. gracilis LEGE 07310]
MVAALYGLFTGVTCAIAVVAFRSAQSGLGILKNVRFVALSGLLTGLFFGLSAYPMYARGKISEEQITAYLAGLGLCLSIGSIAFQLLYAVIHKVREVEYDVSDRSE